ncbi:MAG: DUF4271 domain-containing protein [Saprospiraceae bacterium]|nr:DUF4271 domain-containing protein [Saprospiraceae bacterium]
MPAIRMIENGRVFGELPEKSLYLCPMFRQIFLVLISFGVLPLAGNGQDASNPFELVHRLPKIATAANPGVFSNPFDMVPHQSPGISRVLAENATTEFNPFSILPTGGGLLNSVLLTVLLLILAFLTFSVAANRQAVGKSWRGFLNDNSLNVAQREASGIVGSTPYYMLYVNFLLNAGMFIFLVTRTFQGEKFNNFKFLLICLIGAFVVFLFKHVMVNIVSYLFSIGEESRRYNFLITIFNCVLGLFLVPFNLFIAFSGKGDYQILLVFWMLGLVTIFYGYRTIRSASIGSKFLSSSPFHFLLYLCTVELAPVLFIVKLALMQ